jgi:hypothetical protein
MGLHLFTFCLQKRGIWVRWSRKAKFKLKTEHQHSRTKAKFTALPSLTWRDCAMVFNSDLVTLSLDNWLSYWQMNDMNDFIDKPKKFRKGRLELSRPPIHY